MWTKTKHITLIAFALGCIYTPMQAQTSIQEDELYNSPNYTSDFETEINQSILALRKAEFSLDDTVVANQLAEIGYLAITQSGFTVNKEDIQQRTGYWMLSYPVAIKYGLRINSIIDERKNLTKSTKAAYQYWQELNRIYANVDKADLVFIESAIAVAKYKSDSANHADRSESLIAKSEKLAQIKKTYQESSIKPIGPEAPMVWVSSSKPISFEAIHHFTQILTSELSSLNPQWIDNVYDPQFGSLQLPLQYKEGFEKQVTEMEQKTRDTDILIIAANEKKIMQLKGNIPDLKSHKPIRYKVKSGDNLGRIAQRHHVKISSIRAWNELKSDRIYAGQRLTIYVRNNQKIEMAKKAPKKEKKPVHKTGNFQEYTVQTGDTLWGISQLFDKVSADMIMEDNGIDENISPGQVLKIRKLE
ncbi:MAG: LysM peptidoglycan-binding domain-containing protein [Cyclobacteriaceae bacterium]|nr:LysM peptidoglycan-binding domain-containing protein [Cyclobacteriaceae bacterium]